ncbi:hypothetical protein [Inmirania thermothiophila]|uniref:Uncharacterized protein n=1 Tax=Inmirania thermothiophila TaxID=1750597 RepID=A0A3N1YBE7_9GAMM|nr:hypothetical protein [Inmirania thermothiophila]ROR34972.1 hypothetical protein EDC57_0886 [Inmirania thermothiophila]
MSTTLRPQAGLAPATPLWRRVPARDEAGRPLADFMLLIPGLGRRPPGELEAALDAIGEVLTAHGDAVVFADLNLRLNVLWVSLRPRPGLALALAAALVARVPGARLVAQRVPG